MSDVLTLEPPRPAPERCSNCGAPMHGPFCAACGQEAKPLDPPARRFVREFAQELFDVDGRILRSLKRLFLSPGFLTVEHYEGRRAPWVSPLKLYLSTSVVCFAVLALVGDSGGVEFKEVGDTSRGEPGVERLGFSSLDELRAAVDAARAAWMPRVMFVLVPLVAWLVALVRRRTGRQYPAHLVFTLHVAAAAFGVRALAAVLAAPGPDRLGKALTMLAALYVAAYTYLALRRAYGIGRGLAIRDTLIVGVLSWLALVVATAAIVVAAVFWPTVSKWMGW